MQRKQYKEQNKTQNHVNKNNKFNFKCKGKSPQADSVRPGQSHAPS